MFFIIMMAGIIGLHAESAIVAEGKTKIIRTHDEPALVVIESKDTITAGDGAKRDIILGKAQLANDTACNVFRLLQASKIPCAFVRQLDEKCFLAKKCTMIPYEVVVRREAHGSYLKRHPELSKGHLFSQLKVEFFLKTNDKKWKGQDLPVDDPLVEIDGASAHLLRPDQPQVGQKPFLTLQDFPLKDNPELFNAMCEQARRIFLILEKAWQQAGSRLVDFKIEFGFDSDGNLILADVIDNDSWRVVHQGSYIDKQVYRDGGDLNTVTQLYRQVRDTTATFTLPKQQIIIWRASESDPIDGLKKVLDNYAHDQLHITYITKSLHKDPVRGALLLAKKLQEIPDSVVIVVVGRSNGAGPLLTNFSTVPVITVPANWEKFPEDVWSSLRMPSDMPLLTILDQQNAALAAMRILAKNNGYLYAQVRETQEQRLINIQEIE